MNDRAKQFSAFSPLRGYHEMIKAKERIVVPRRELTEDSAQELSVKLSRVQKAMIVKIIYYSEGEYIAKEGVVSKMDLYSKKVTLVKTEINFEDIYDITFFSNDEKSKECLSKTN